MYCKYCGKPLDVDTRFCPHCGKAVSADMHAPHATVKQAVSVPNRITCKKVIKGIILGLILTAVFSPLILIGRELILSSALNPENRASAVHSQSGSDFGFASGDATSGNDLELYQEVVSNGEELTYPNIPIVFTSDRDDPNFEECNSTNYCSSQVFYSAAPLTDLPVNLTQPLGFGSAQSPALSPDGTRVAFEGYMPGSDANHIYVVNIDGSGLKKVSPDSYNHMAPSWSPDGTQLIYMSRPNAGTFYNLYIVDINSNITRQLTTGDFMDRFPAWSPDGKSIALQSNRLDPDPAHCLPSCKYYLFVMDVETLSGNPLMSEGNAINGNGVDWSPDGSQMAFYADWSGNSDIYILDEDGNIRQLTTTLGWDTSPRWSPDGNFIIYTSETETGTNIAVTPVEYFDPILYTDHTGTNRQPDW